MYCSHCPIFVIGYMHSGTTLLQKVISKHPSVFSGKGETRFFATLPITRQRFSDLENNTVLENYIKYLIGIISMGFGQVNFYKKDQYLANDYFITPYQFDQLFLEAKQNREHIALFKITHSLLTEWSNKMRWLEKTPTHLFYIDQIIKEIPDALFVEIVRDARDVLTSKYIRKSSGWMGKFSKEKQSIKRLVSNYNPLWDALSWKSAIHATKAARVKYPEKILRIRYEDFVSNPEKETLYICNFLKLPFDTKMLDIGWVNTTTRLKQSSKGISRAAIGKWKQNLPSEDVVLCQQITKSELISLDYEIVKYGPYDYLKMIYPLSKSVPELLRRIYKRWKLGGATFLRDILKNYWLRFLNLSRS